MLRSMYAGVSGLKAHMNKMDIIGNNIANVNTTGYKRSRATFKTMLSQTIQGASAPQEGRGGTNPQEIGLGVSLGSIDVDMGQGNLQSTGRNTDLAIQGDGFFVMNQNGRNLYSRAGATTFDRDGFLVNATNGLRIQGWMADANGNIDSNGDLGNITLNPSMSASASDNINYAGNLNSDVTAYGGATPPTTDAEQGAYDAATRTTSIDVYDSQGSPHTVDLNFTKTGANTWEYEVSDVSGTDGSGLTNEGGTLVFDAAGKLNKGASTFPGDLQFTPDGGAEDLAIDLDFSGLTQYSGNMTADIDTITGYQAGSIQKFAIDGSGTITGFYDNGKRQTIGQIAVARFNNASGLASEGETMFAESNNSGQAKIGAPGEGSFGALAAGTLEMSNVDLSREFTEMITTQRGFQANSKTISTADQILQELVNLKR